MPNKYNGRHGLTGTDVRNLSARYYKIESTWKTKDDFIKWAGKHGYQKGRFLRRYDEDMPHGPDNSYWYSRTDEKNDVKRRKDFRRDNVSEFCQSCDKKCPSQGCVEYRQWWSKNWNQTLHRKKEVQPEPQEGVTRVWQYEHPDLVREGICFIAET